MPDPYEPDIPAIADPPVVRLSDGEREIVLIGTIHFVPSELADRLLELPAALYDDIDAADIVFVESDLVTLDPIRRLMTGLEVRRSLEEDDADRGRPSLKELLDAQPERAIDIVSLLAELQDRADQEPYIESLLFTLDASVDREVMTRTRSNHALMLVERWSRSQLTGIEASPYEMLGIEIPDSVRRAWDEHDTLVFDVRERTWVRRILDRIEREGVRRMVVAAGAAHLVDDRAILLDLLTEAGFEKTAP